MTVKSCANSFSGTKRPAADSILAPAIKKRRRAGVFRSLPLSRTYIQQILSGQKTVEGRIYKLAVRSICQGDVLHFHMYNPQRQSVICEVLQKKVYRTFQAMLADVGYQNCIPEAENMEEALSQYHEIPKYSKKEKEFGVVAFHLRMKIPAEHRVLIQGSYFDFIKKGKKTVDVRVFYHPHSEISIGDLILFENEDTHETQKARVLQLHLYASFEEMLIEETLAKCLPDTGSIDEGIKFYRSFPHYAEREKLCGVVAFRIKKL